MTLGPGLSRIDGRVRRRVAEARAGPAEPDGEGHDPLAGYYVSEAEVDRLLAAPADASNLPDPLLLQGLAAAFGLEPFDVDVLLTCLAPELDRRYGRLYAYLNDDVTRRAPTVDLVLSLWCPDPSGRLAARARLAPGAPLRRHGLLRLDESGGPASMLECALLLDPRVTRHLLGDDDPDERLADLLEPEPARPGSPRALTDPAAEQLARIAGSTGADVVVHLTGPAGSGRRAAAEAFCRSAGRPLLVVRGDALAREPAARCAELTRLVAREARLRGAATYWRSAGDLAAVDGGARRAAFAAALEGVPGPVLLGLHEPWDGPDPAGRPVVRVSLGYPDAAARKDLWAGLIAPPFDDADPPDPAVLAAAFRFTPGRIRAAVAAATTLAVVRGSGGSGAPLLRHADLAAAARSRSGHGLAGVARHVVTPYGWDDLVLPPEATSRLRGIADQVRLRGLVHDTWEFGRSVAPTPGLVALFAGPSGTGKTMAASVLANTLGVDLYAVDLATTVSKYIGETEKNLARLFEAAADSNAILFFDEADALFGRRTQVRDAHDRYANLETSYLLQQIETHPGVVVLATNLRKNMDEAFVRRFRATVEFPSPGEAERLRIWQRLWPDAAPRATDVDLATLARRIDLPGGHIRNIVLAGAFLAAADGGTITMAHVVRAARSEYEKLGKLVADGDL